MNDRDLRKVQDKYRPGLKRKEKCVAKLTRRLQERKQ